jgi:hypothetical protein
MHVMIMHGATYTSCPLTETVQYTLLVVLLFYLVFYSCFQRTLQNFV